MKKITVVGQMQPHFDFASKRQWQGASVDVPTPFLKAEMNQELIKQPYHLVEKGVLQKDIMYEPMKAVYGFR